MEGNTVGRTIHALRHSLTPLKLITSTLIHFKKVFNLVNVDIKLI